MQFVTPVLEQALALGPFEHVTLPAHKVGVLSLLRGSGRRLTRSETRVGFLELLKQKQDRPAVHRDVIDRVQQHVVIGAQAEKLRANHRAFLDVERLLVALDRALTNIVDRQPFRVDAFEWHTHAAMHVLHDVAVDGRVGRPQRRVAVDEHLVRLFQCGIVQFRRYAYAKRRVIGRTVRIGFMQEPERSLCVGQRVSRDRLLCLLAQKLPDLVLVLDERLLQLGRQRAFRRTESELFALDPELDLSLRQELDKLRGSHSAPSSHSALSSPSATPSAPAFV